jgi:hypothetical protein
MPTSKWNTVTAVHGTDQLVVLDAGTGVGRRVETSALLLPIRIRSVHQDLGGGEAHAPA